MADAIPVPPEGYPDPAMMSRIEDLLYAKEAANGVRSAVGDALLAGPRKAKALLAQLLGWLADSTPGRLFRRGFGRFATLAAAAARFLARVGPVPFGVYVASTPWGQRAVRAVGGVVTTVVRTVMDVAVDGTSWLLDRLGRPGRWLASKLRAGRDWAYAQLGRIRRSAPAARLGRVLDAGSSPMFVVRTVSRGAVALGAAGLVTTLSPWLAVVVFTTGAATPGLGLGVAAAVAWLGRRLVSAFAKLGGQSGADVTRNGTPGAAPGRTAGGATVTRTGPKVNGPTAAQAPAGKGARG